MHWFMCFLGYSKKLNMWFQVLCVLNVLWIFIQNKNYVIKSTERQLDTSRKRSHKRLRLETNFPVHTDISELGSCQSSLENVSSSLTVTDVALLPNDAPSTSSNTRYLKTTSLEEMLSESQSKPSLPVLMNVSNEPEKMQIVSDSDKSHEETDELLNDIIKMINSEPVTIYNEAMMKSDEDWDAFTDSDEPDDGTFETCLNNLLTLLSSNSQTMDNEATLNESNYSDNQSNLDVLIGDSEYVLLNQILSPLKYWDSDTLENNVSNALNVLPEAAGDPISKSENITCDQVECSMEDVPSVSNIHLKDVELQHETNVDNVTTGNEASSDVLEKEAMEKKNDGDMGNVTSCEGILKWGIPSNMKSIDMKLVKNMTKKLIQDLELNNYIDENQIYESLEEADKSISCESEYKIDIANKNRGKSTIIPLFFNIVAYKVKLKFADKLKTVPDLLNSFVIFNSCFACLLAVYHTLFSQQFHAFERRRVEKRSVVLDIIGAFVNMDKPKSSIRLSNLLNFTATKKKKHNHYYIDVMKLALCLPEKDDSRLNMRHKLKEYYNKLENLYAFPTQVANICKDETKDVDAKAQDLKKRLQSYVNEMQLFLSALEDRQKKLITQISSIFSNVKEATIIIFYYLGNKLIFLFNWSSKLKTNFLFVLIIFNQLLIACKNYVDYKSNYKEEISSFLKENELLLKSLFENMYLWMYMALIVQLKLLAEKTLKDIKEETNKSEKFNVHKVLEMIDNLCCKVNSLKEAVFSTVVDINAKREQWIQQEHRASELHEIDENVKTLMQKVSDKKSAIRKKKMKQEASAFEKIIKDFNAVITKMGIQSLEEDIMKQLKEYVQSVQGT